MQKLALILCWFLFVANALYASNQSDNSNTLFLDNLSVWDCEMAGLSELEQWVQETNTTRTEMQRAGNPLTSYLLPDADIAASLFEGSNPERERLLDIPGLFWGFCCSFVGTFLVYLAIDDPIAKKREGTQAILGCAVGTALWVGLYVWFVFSVSQF